MPTHGTCEGNELDKGIEEAFKVILAEQGKDDGKIDVEFDAVTYYGRIEGMEGTVQLKR